MVRFTGDLDKYKHDHFLYIVAVFVHKWDVLGNKIAINLTIPLEIRTQMDMNNNEKFITAEQRIVHRLVFTGGFYKDSISMKSISELAYAIMDINYLDELRKVQEVLGISCLY